MPREKSSFLSALGTLFALLKLVVDDVLTAGGTDEDIRKAFNDAETRGNIVEVILTSRRLARRQLGQWKDFYKKYFNIKLDIDTIKIPAQQPGFDRLIVVAGGLTLNQVYDVLAKHFPCWRYAEDLDKAIPTNDRDSKNGAYAIWVRDRVEADEENKNLSANQLKEQSHAGITVLERMIYELKYWDETQKHLDIQMLTLCTCSRGSGGDVPSAYWSDDEFWVDWYGPDDRSDDLRSRSAVS